MTLNVLIHFGIFGLVASVELEHMSVRAKHLTENRIHHLDSEAGLCHAKTNDLLLDPVTITAPRFVFGLLGEEVGVDPELGGEILDEADTIAKQTRSATLELVLKNVPLIHPLPPVFDQLVCFDVGFPSGMHTTIGEQETLEAFGVVVGSY